MYALVSPDNKLIQYPLSINQWRADHSSISLPFTPTPEQLAEQGIVIVEPSVPPVKQYTLNYEETAELSAEGIWVQTWIATDASPAEIYARTQAQESEVRQLRNQKLADCDWTQLPDTPVDAAAWSEYRANLRDVPSQTGFPWEIVWPEEPA